MSKIHESKEKYYLTFYGINDENAPDIVFAITNQGTGYTSAPTITITPATASLGTGMKATCTVAAGKITSVILLNRGTGYTGGLLNVAVAGGGGASGAITATQVYNKGYTKTLENLTAFDNCKHRRTSWCTIVHSVHTGVLVAICALFSGGIQKVCTDFLKSHQKCAQNFWRLMKSVHSISKLLSEVCTSF